MWSYRRFFAKLKNLVRPAKAENELARELAAHLTLLEDDFARLGMRPEEARLAAKRAYGGVELAKEMHRDERSFPWLEQTMRDIRHACRNLTRTPGFTLIAIATLALGIGVNAALFSAYNSIALKPLPVADPNEVVRVERWYASGSQGDVQYAFSYPEYQYCRDRGDSFAALVAASWPRPVVLGSLDRAAVQLVSANYFSDLGVNARLGRTFLAEEGRPDANAVAVISDSFWHREFDGDSQILGKTIQANGAVLTIIGIAPASFTGTSTLPQVPDFWAPLSMQRQLVPGNDWLHQPDDLELQILARLKASTTLNRAQSQIDSLIRQFATTFKQRDATKKITLQHTAFFGNTDDIRFKAFIAALMLVVGSVLLAACANVANMSLARGAARERELRIRVALGASRARIFRQLLTESIVLSLLGGIGGLLLSIWTAKLLWLSIEHIFSGLFDDTLVFHLDVSPDVRVFLYTLAVSLATGLLFGLSPALRYSRALTSQLHQSRTRAILVALQVAISLVLLICTGLLLRGVTRAQTSDPGFDTKGLVILSGELGHELSRQVDLERMLVERLRTMPGVKSAALGTVPLLGTWTPPILIEGHRTPDSNSIGRTLASYASDTYFETLGITLVRGRNFTAREATGGAPVAVISQATARRFWPGRNPIGKRFKLDLQFQGKYTQFEVIGIAKDVRFANLTRPDPSHIYIATGTDEVYGILLRTEGDLKTSSAIVRSAAGKLDTNLLPSLLLMSFENGPLRLQRSLASIYAIYAGALALIALSLAGIGIYGVMSYLVSQRTAEIGIRMALGASPSAVLKSVLLQGLRATLIGTVIGIAVAAALSRTMHSALAFPGAADLFYGVPYYDPVTFIGLSAFLLAIAAIATSVPARRAISVDPTIALRHA